MKDAKLLYSLMTPSLWLGLLLAALFLLGAGGAVGYRVADKLAEIAALKVEGDRATERFNHAQQLADAEAKTTATEKKWADHVGQVALNHKQEMDDAHQKIDALRADVRTGAVRLSVAVKATRATCDSPAGGNPAVASGAVEEARAELMPQAADDLISIAADGDDAVRDFNACHDAYEAVRQRGNQ